MPETKILITGASGYVGAKLYVDLKDKYRVTGTYFGNQLFPELVKLDLTDSSTLKSFVTDLKPEIIIHAANYANHAYMQEHPVEAEKLNVESTRVIVDAAKELGVKVIFISSFAAYNGTDIYGQDKIKSETMVVELPHYVILRPSLIVGLSPNTTNDRPFNRILKNITEHTPAIYDNSWQFEVTYLRHLSEVIQKIIADNNIDRVMISVAAKGITSRYQLAQDILLHFGLTATPENKHAELPHTEVDYSAYKKYGFPEYSYAQVVENIVNEIKGII